MVQSNAATVDAFIATLEPDRAEAMRRLRDICRRRLTGWEERMQWGMPGYGPPGEDARISFNSQVRHIAVYAGKAAVDTFKPHFKGATFGKGCVRFANAALMDFDGVEAMIAQAFESKTAGC